MKKNILILSILTVVSLRCTKNSSNPFLAEGENLEGYWKTNGIIVYQWNKNLGKETEFYFQNGNLKLTANSYSLDVASNNWVLEYYTNLYLKYRIDNNFMIITDMDDPTVSVFPFFLHYSFENNRLLITTGNMYLGSSNNLVNTIWEGNISYYETGTLESYNTKEIFYENNTGVRITNHLNSHFIDTIKFTYSISGDELIISSEFISMGGIYVYEIKDNKLYTYYKPGDANDPFNMELIRQPPAESPNDDYFPLKTGNSWTYNYRYFQPFSYNSTGKIKWTVINENNSEYQIQEIFSGITLSYYSNNDTLFNGTDTAYFYIKQENKTLTMEPVLFKCGKVRFERYYFSKKESFVLSTVSTTNENEYIGLTRGKGVVGWRFGGSHNGDIFGELGLVERNVIKNIPIRKLIHANYVTTK